MQKQKKWQLYLIVAVIALTLYNILPTIFYYAKPLKKPIDSKQAEVIAKDIENRVNSLEEDSTLWIKSFCNLLKVSPSEMKLDQNNPEKISVTFKTDEDAQKFRNFFPRAGALIPFVPAQLSLSSDDLPKKVTIQRQIPLHFDVKNTSKYFEFTNKYEDSRPTKKYREIVFDRVSSLSLALFGPGEAAIKVLSINENPENYASTELLYALSHELISYTQTFGENSPICKRYYASFTREIKNPKDAISSLLKSYSSLRDQLKIERSKLTKDKDKLDSSLEEKVKLLDAKQLLLMKAESLVKKHESEFISSESSLNYNSLMEALENAHQKSEKILTFGLNTNPLIKQIVIDWANEKIYLTLHDDAIAFKNSANAALLQMYDQIIINEVARLTRLTDESLAAHENEFVVNLNTLSSSKSVLIFKLQEVAKAEAKIAEKIIKENWHPAHKELSLENFPIYDYATYQKLPSSEKSLCLVIFTPSIDSVNEVKGMKESSSYVIAKGLDKILQKYQDSPSSESAKQFFSDFNSLREKLRQNGFIGYPGSSLPANEFTNDFIFEKDNYYFNILKASRENFNVYGQKKYAVLEFSDVEQRILTLNKIQTSIHEDLSKWYDEYNSSKANSNFTSYDVPAPTKNLFWSNFVLSFDKYFRGDDRKILHWGLDLSGGKTVQLELKDQNGKVVKDEEALKQGVNELYNRVNKMGVSDLNIRIVSPNIILDFPGAQNLSAADLVKASSMYFNVVNEKFSTFNKSLSDNVQRFLQEIWNEAVVTNRKDIESINEIAWKHLYGDSLNTEIAQPRSEAAKILYENGLRLALSSETSAVFDDKLSKIAIFRGNEYTKWEGQTHPLLIVFNNYALEGSSLTNVRSSYDPSKGNFLSFEVKGSHSIKDQKVNSRDLLYAWTSHFSKEKIAGTPLADYSKGRGWRMAVILNDTVISSPNLESALRDSAVITGSFTQREINQLVADLKAGSLSYTPHILSEKNVSPELGKQERLNGIVAAIVALSTVIIAMVSYYRFSGVVASIAVLFNLLIMWATLQNIGATLSLAGIAGAILTVGMAVDANVLVYERIKEEFAICGKIGTAVYSGYRKAFSAILDSNVTTIIAALILLHFDSGPIKGFAITLIIGIASSMFSALFMTRFFFTKWVQNPIHTELKMSNIIKATKVQFLKNAKYIIALSVTIIIIGSFFLVSQRKSILGMDFTGGYALTVELEEGKKDYRRMVEEALISKGASAKEIQIRELNSPNNLRILLGTSMELSGKPFYNMPIVLENKSKHSYETNPRINWIVSALKDKGIKITSKSLESLDKSWTAMSGQMSESMRNNALIGLVLALVAIFIYITFRFEYKFAISAMLCLVHDVIACLGIIAILNAFRVPIQIDLHTVAALMTIVGYSLNDTIIVFDRIREEMKLMRKYPLAEIVNHSLNITLSRTCNTSITVLLVLLALVFLGGSTLFSFALVMVIGVVVGTLSSWFIASPLMLFFHRMESKKSSDEVINE